MPASTAAPDVLVGRADRRARPPRWSCRGCRRRASRRSGRRARGCRRPRPRPASTAGCPSRSGRSRCRRGRARRRRPSFSPGAPIARSAKPSPLKLPTASARPKSSPSSGVSAIPAESCDQNCEPAVTTPVALPRSTWTAPRRPSSLTPIARSPKPSPLKSPLTAADADQPALAIGGGGGVQEMRAGAQRVAAGVAVVGPVDRLAAGDALAVRRDREALVVEVGHAGGAGVVGHGGEAARVAWPRVDLEDAAAAVAVVVADHPQLVLVGVPVQRRRRSVKPLANVATRVKLLEVWSSA